MYLFFMPVMVRKHLLVRLVKLLKVEIYPREGTETIICFFVLVMKRVEIYPREGAETRRNKCYQDTTLWLKFIPVRGRKLPNKSSNNHPFG